MTVCAKGAAVQLAGRVVRLKYQYIESIVQELELAVGEPNWFLADTKAGQSRRVLASQTAAIQEVCGQRLRQAGHASPPELQAWLSANERLLGLMTGLGAAIDHRRAGEALERIASLRAVVGKLAGEAPAVFEQVATLSGDFSADLARALGRIGPEMD